MSDRHRTPSFQFYPSDWLSSQKIETMTLEEQGIYIRLMCHDWLNDGIPEDPKMIARLGRTTEENGKRISELCFRHHPRRKGLMTNLRLEQERQKQKLNRMRRIEAGKAGAEARWGQADKCDCHADANAITMAKNSLSTPTPTPSSSSTSTTKPKPTCSTPLNGEAFDKFWKAYPKRKAKSAAIKAFKKINPDATLLAVILAAVTVGGRIRKAGKKKS